VPGFEAPSWFAIVGPANMPKPIVDKINAGVAQVFTEKEFQDQLLKPHLFTPMVSSPADFTAFIKSDAPKWKAAIEHAHVQLE
jgi:tripartite-type tricarboxylate transporter receptor subunit TctC